MYDVLAAMYGLFNMAYDVLCVTCCRFCIGDVVLVIMLDIFIMIHEFGMITDLRCMVHDDMILVLSVRFCTHPLVLCSVCHL